MKYTPQKDYKVYINKLQKVVPIHKRGQNVWLGFVYNSKKKNNPVEFIAIPVIIIDTQIRKTMKKTNTVFSVYYSICQANSKKVIVVSEKMLHSTIGLAYLSIQNYLESMIEIAKKRARNKERQNNIIVLNSILQSNSINQMNSDDFMINYLENKAFQASLNTQSE